MNRFLRWLSPLVLAIVITAGIRLVTDMASSCPFWNRPMMINLKDFLSTIISCYILDFLFRYLVKSKFRQEKGWRVMVEYMLLAFVLFVGITLSSFIAHYYINSPNYLIDFIIAYVVSIPTALFYYSILRNNEIKQEYALQALQLEKMKSGQLTTELNLLKAQYHPHFLFNALNTVYFQVDEENSAAKQTIELLSDLLRYQLYDVHNEVTIKDEIHFLHSYIDFQKLRVSERLKLTVTIDPRLSGQMIHPLLFQPLLENAFKYVGGGYWMNINLDLDHERIRFMVENATDNNLKKQDRNAGIGIENLRRRLELLYPEQHQLSVIQKEHSFIAELILNNQQNANKMCNYR